MSDPPSAGSSSKPGVYRLAVPSYLQHGLLSSERSSPRDSQIGMIGVLYPVLIQVDVVGMRPESLVEPLCIV